MAVAACGHIAACSINWDSLLTRDNAWADLHLHVFNGGTLRLGKAAHVLMGELDVVLELLRNLVRGGGDLFFREDHVAFVLVELLRVFQRRLITARLDIGEDVLDDCMRFGRIGFRRKWCLLQIGARHFFYLVQQCCAACS